MGSRFGRIEVIAGCMFSGKTEELMRRLRRAEIAKQNVVVFKPIVDNRFARDKITSHNGISFPATMVRSGSEILDLIESAQVVGIDEGQFFDQTIVQTCETLAEKGFRVIVAGLDMDYKGEPFGSMPILLSIAEEITKLNAICQDCGDTAHFSQRISGSTNEIEIGAKDKYQAKCRQCFVRMQDQKYMAIEFNHRL